MMRWQSSCSSQEFEKGSGKYKEWTLPGRLKADQKETRQEKGTVIGGGLGRTNTLRCFPDNKEPNQTNQTEKEKQELRVEEKLLLLGKWRW